MGHGELRHGQRQPHQPHPSASLSALAGHALLGLHLLLRIQGQFGRVQIDGPGPLRPAEARRLDPRKADRPEGGRVVPHGHVVLQLLPGPDDDVEEIRPALWRPAAFPRDAVDRARHGHCRLDPGCHRGDHAADGAARSCRDGDETALSGRWRRAQLRRQRADPSRGSVRRPVDPTGRRRRGGRFGGCPFHLAPTARSTRVREPVWMPSAGRTSALNSATTRFAGFSTASAPAIDISTTRTSCATPLPA